MDNIVACNDLKSLCSASWDVGPRQYLFWDKWALNGSNRKQNLQLSKSTGWELLSLTLQLNCSSFRSWLQYHRPYWQSMGESRTIIQQVNCSQLQIKSLIITDANLKPYHDAKDKETVHQTFCFIFQVHKGKP